MQRLLAALFSALMMALVLSQQSFANEWVRWSETPDEYKEYVKELMATASKTAKERVRSDIELFRMGRPLMVTFRNNDIGVYEYGEQENDMRRLESEQTDKTKSGESNNDGDHLYQKRLAYLNTPLGESSEAEKDYVVAILYNPLLATANDFFSIGKAGNRYDAYLDLAIETSPFPAQRILDFYYGYLVTDNTTESEKIFAIQKIKSLIVAAKLGYFSLAPGTRSIIEQLDPETSRQLIRSDEK